MFFYNFIIACCKLMYWAFLWHGNKLVWSFKCLCEPSLLLCLPQHTKICLSTNTLQSLRNPVPKQHHHFYSIYKLKPFCGDFVILCFLKHSLFDFPYFESSNVVYWDEMAFCFFFLSSFAIVACSSCAEHIFDLDGQLCLKVHVRIMLWHMF